MWANLIDPSGTCSRTHEGQLLKDGGRLGYEAGVVALEFLTGHASIGVSVLSIVCRVSRGVIEDVANHKSFNDLCVNSNHDCALAHERAHLQQITRDPVRGLVAQNLVKEQEINVFKQSGDRVTSIPVGVQVQAQVLLDHVIFPYD